MSDADEREAIRRRKQEALVRRFAGDEREGERPSSGAPDRPIPVDGADHLRRLADEHDVVLVDFHAEWCGPCQMLEPTVAQLAAETPAAVAKVDIDRHPTLARQAGVRGVPTLLLYAGGEPVERLVGMQDKTVLADLVERHAA